MLNRISRRHAPQLGHAVHCGAFGLVLGMSMLWVARTSCQAIPTYPTPTAPNIPSTIFNVASYGAVGNDSMNDTTAIQNAINAAHAAGGGTVLVSGSDSIGSSFLSGPLTMLSNVNLEVNGELAMLPYGTYPANAGNSYTNFINGSGVSNVEVSGTGIINGQGAPWWAAYEASNFARPQMVAFQNSSVVEVAGLTLENPPNTHINIDACTNVTVNGVNISTTSSSPNTDGIDISAQNALIENSSISDGDDNIAIGGDSLSKDITITNDSFGSGHGCSIGSFTDGGAGGIGLNGLVVTNCTFNGTSNGIRLKSSDGRGGVVENLYYSGLTMTNVPTPLSIESYYPNDPSSPVGDAPGTTTEQPDWTNINISNLTSTYTGSNASSANQGILWGLPNLYISDVTLTNVNLAAASTKMVLNYVTGLSIVNSQINIDSSSDEPYDATYTVSVPEPASSFGLIIVAASSLLTARRWGRRLTD
jgi:polygalacturonase